MPYRICLVWILIGFAWLHGCSREAPEPLRIGTNIWPGYEPLYLARDLGYFEQDHPVRLVEFTSASQVINAYRNDAIEAAALTLDEALLVNQYSNDSKIILVMDISNGADVILGQPGIKNLESIRGLYVGVETTALGSFMINRALATVGLTQQDILIVPLDANEHERVFLDQQIDAVVTFEPMRSRLLAHKANLLFDSSSIPDEIIDVLVVRDAYLKKYPDIVQHLLHGWFKSLRYLADHPLDAAKRMVPRLQLAPQEIINSYNLLMLPDREKNLEFFAGPEPILENNAALMQEVMLNGGLIRHRVQTNDLFAIEPLQESMREY